MFLAHLDDDEHGLEKYLIQFADIYLPDTDLLYHGGAHYHRNSAVRASYLVIKKKKKLQSIHTGTGVLPPSRRFSLNSVC